MVSSFLFTIKLQKFGGIIMAFYPYGQPNYGGATYPAYQPNYQSMQPAQTVQTQQQISNVNKIYVTSLEDALARFSNTNTITVYHLQDESAEIEIAVDGFGKKSYKMRKLTDISPEEKGNGQNSTYATQEETNGLKRQITALEERLKVLEKQTEKSTKNNSSKKAEDDEIE